MPCCAATVLAALSRSYAVFGEMRTAQRLAEEAILTAGDRGRDSGEIATLRISLLNLQGHHVWATRSAPWPRSSAPCAIGTIVLHDHRLRGRGVRQGEHQRRRKPSPRWVALVALEPANAHFLCIFFVHKAIPTPCYPDTRRMAGIPDMDVRGLGKHCRDGAHEKRAEARS